MKDVVLPDKVLVLTRNEVDLSVPLKQEDNVLLQQPELVVGRLKAVLSANIAQPEDR